jgi:DNA-binding beta-propeller fold protein YncE
MPENKPRAVSTGKKDITLNPGGLAYDYGKSEIFVANFGSNTVSVISDI